MQANKLYLHTNLNNFFSSLKDCQKAKRGIFKTTKKAIYLNIYTIYIQQIFSFKLLDFTDFLSGFFKIFCPTVIGMDQSDGRSVFKS